MKDKQNTRYKTVNWITNKNSASYKPKPSNIRKIHEAWAVAHGYRTKVQATSAKPQAPSSKRQASSRKL